MKNHFIAIRVQPDIMEHAQTSLCVPPKKLYFRTRINIAFIFLVLLEKVINPVTKGFFDDVLTA